MEKFLACQCAVKKLLTHSYTNYVSLYITKFYYLYVIIVLLMFVSCHFQCEVIKVCWPTFSKLRKWVHFKIWIPKFPVHLKIGEGQKRWRDFQQLWTLIACIFETEQAQFLYFVIVQSPCAVCWLNVVEFCPCTKKVIDRSLDSPKVNMQRY